MGRRITKAYYIVSLAIVVIFLVAPMPEASAQQYVFKRMWPTLQQPWYFSGPTYISLDNNGNVFVSDTHNHRILKFSLDGIFITKWGRNGTGDGEFDEPYGIAVDGSGYVYVVDIGNNRIQKFSPEGDFITKWGEAGAGAGQFNSPYGVAVDQQGFVYVADEGNHRVQKFSSGGEFIMQWGTYGTGHGEFKCPSGVAVDTQGFLYVADYDNHRIQKFSSDGVYITKWGEYGTGGGQFDSPFGITADRGGFIYVTDYGNNRVQKFSADGMFIAQWGGSGTDNGQFHDPYGIAANGDLLYVADYRNNRIQKFSSDGVYITKWGSIGRGDGEFYYPYGTAVDSGGFIYVTDDGNHRVQKFSADGVFIMKWGSYGTGDGRFDCPTGVDVDSSDSYVYVVDYGNSRIQKFDPDGGFITKWGSYGTGDGQFRSPYGVAVDESGFVYVADTGNNRIQKFSPDGSFVTAWGEYGTGDGEFAAPHDIAAGEDGYIYVTDEGNNRVQKFTPDGTFITAWGSHGSGEGYLDRPWGIDTDGDGFVYVTDGGNYRTQKFTETGLYVTSWRNDTAETDHIAFPSSLAVAEDGSVITADVNNSRIMVYQKAADSSRNKAIIVAAGGPFEGNQLWDATQISANFAYQVLAYQGFTKDNIYYMTADTDLDIDSNGEPDDVDSDLTLAGLYNAVTAWAADADNLLLYIVDHGGQGSARMNGSEILHAADLDEWLDTLQDAMAGKVIIVYDACESGSFLPALLPPSGKERIIISSTSAGESAYFINQGSVSFSYFFWTNIFNGNNVKDAFDMAKNALGQAISGQTPLLDDNGNGTGGEPGDGTLAVNTYIGNGTTVQGDSPSIAGVSQDQVLDGTASAALSAYNVTDTDGIARVWAVIIPPGYSAGASNNAVQGLPYIDLLPAGGGLYEATYDQFNIEGTYQISIYARDRIGNTSVPMNTTVSVGNPLRRKAIIVAGGDMTDDNWNAVERGALSAYSALTFQGYTDQDIYFLSPVTFTSGVDGLSVISNLQYAVNTWAADSARDVVVYIIGSGDDGSFRINNTETLYAADLDAWLDTLQSSVPDAVTVIYDADRAGSFLPLLTPPAGSERIVLAGTGGDDPAYFLSEGNISFSRYFWSRILNGLNIRDAWLYARQAMSFASGQKQTAMLDDNGNGTGNETGDGVLAHNYTIGAGIQLAGSDPLIGSVVPDQVLQGQTSSAIWADSVTSTGTMDRVWAVITPPGYVAGRPDQSVRDLPELVLVDSGDNMYEGIYNDFSVFGLYYITIYAMDIDGHISTVKETTVEQTNAPDIYEEDDSYNQAGVIVLNDPLPQHHHFHDAGDEDWVKFYGLGGETFEIRVANPGPDNDAVLELYDEDGVTLIAGVNNPGAGVEEVLNWTFTSDGTYYVRVTHAGPAAYGMDTGYDLYVYIPAMPSVYGLIAGTVSDASSGDPIQNVTVRTGYGLSDISRADGTYIIFHPSGTYSITASRTGYETYQDTFTISGSVTVTKHIPMTAVCVDIDEDGYGDPGSSGCSGGSARDCEDNNNLINPGEPEVCDGTDNDCNGLVDDSDPGVEGQTTWHPDNDTDGYGNGSISLQQCSWPSGYVVDNMDCNDNDENIYPGGPPVRTLSSAAYYYSLQDAYDAAADGDVIQSKEGYFIQDLSLDLDKAITFQGGFDCGFSSQIGSTVINGNITHYSGSVSLGGFLIE